MDKTIKSIAILRLSAIGDVCHAMAVVHAVQKEYPDASITWITGPLEAQIVKLLPNVKVCIFDKKQGWKGMWALKRSFVGDKFDVLLHLQWSIRASFVSRMIPAKRRIGFHPSISREKQHWFVNDYGEQPARAHVLDSFLSVSARIGVSSIELPLPLNLPESRVCGDYVVLNPSASKAERNWTEEGYRELIDWLVSNGQRVILTGGGSAAEKQLASMLTTSGVENLVGQTSLPEMMSILASAKLVISPDTGPAHMATIVGTKVVGLYAHSNPKRTGPYCDLDKVVSVYEQMAEKEYGKSVSELPWATRVHSADAMKAITCEQVIAQVRSLI